jgi:hypothetical protein
VGARSLTQKTVALSVTEAETNATVQWAQDMLLTMRRVVKSFGLQVGQPMILQVDNKGAHNLAHNWSIGGRTQHINVQINFLQKLKEEGILVLEWIAGNENASDLFTKNLHGLLEVYLRAPKCYFALLFNTPVGFHGPSVSLVKCMAETKKWSRLARMTGESTVNAWKACSLTVENRLSEWTTVESSGSDLKTDILILSEKI